MCIKKAARLRRRLAATSRVDTTQARNRWRTPWRNILSPWDRFRCFGGLNWCASSRHPSGGRAAGRAFRSTGQGDQSKRRRTAPTRQGSRATRHRERGGRSREQGLTPETVGERISEFAGKVGEVVQKAKEEVGTAAKDEKLTVEQLKAEASSAAEGGKQDRKGSVQKKSDEG